MLHPNTPIKCPSPCGMCTTCKVYGQNQLLEEILCAILDQNELLKKLLLAKSMKHYADCSDSMEEESNGI